MKKGTKIFVAFVTTFILVLSFAATEARAVYPEKPVKFIIPYSPGGSSDLTARLLAPELEKVLGQRIIVENVVGAGGWVGWNTVMKANPDGYTICELTLTYVASYLNPEMKRVENLDSLTTLVNHVIDHTAWAARTDFPYKNMNDLLAYVKENPGKIKVGITGKNSQHHRLLILLERLGYKMEPVITTGTADSTSLAIGGHLDIASIGAGDVRQQVKAGTMIPLCVFSKKRSVFLPDVQTMFEQTGLELEGFAARGIVGPKNMDPEAVRILCEAFDKVMTDPEWAKKMEKIGQEVYYIDHENYRTYLENVEKEIKDTLGW